MFNVIGEIFKRNLIGIIQIVAIPLVGLFLLGQYFFESSYDFFFGNEDHSLETGHNLQLGISRELIIGNDRKYLLRYSSKSAKAINEFSQYVGFIDMYDPLLRASRAKRTDQKGKPHQACEGARWFFG